MVWHLMYQTMKAVLTKQEELYDVLEQMKECSMLVMIMNKDFFSFSNSVGSLTKRH